MASPPLLSCLMALALAGASPPGGESAPGAPPGTHLDNKAASQLLVHLVKPLYPPIAELNYIQGKVRLEIRVDRRGLVTAVHVLEGEPLLAAAAYKAVKKWRYKPFLHSNAAKPFVTDVSVEFNLRISAQHWRLPPHAEKFLSRQIHPPEVASRPREDSGAERVPLRVLVGANGKVLDAMPLEPTRMPLKTARRNLQRWKFRPARWGTLAVPWYVKVEVPMGKELGQGRGSNPNSP